MTTKESLKVSCTVERSNVEGDISTVIIVDRSIDPVTPFMSQMTYQGLLDEFYKLEFSYIEMHPSVVDSKIGPNEECKPIYKSLRRDPVFYEIKDMNIRLLGKYMAKAITDIKQLNHIIRENKEMDQLEAVKILKENNDKVQILAMHQNLSYPILKSMDTDFEKSKLALLDVSFSNLGNRGWHQRQRPDRKHRRLDHSSRTFARDLSCALCSFTVKKRT